MRARNAKRRIQSVRTAPSTSGRGHRIDDEDGVAELDPVARAEHDLVNRDSVHPGSVRAVEIRQDESSPPSLEPGVVTRRPRVAQDQIVVGGPADREWTPVEDERS